MLLICPHALLLCFRYLMDVFLFSLCVRLQRRVLEPKQPNCAFGLIIRDPMLWNNELNSNQSSSCCWLCVYHHWSSLDCINVPQRACTVVSLQTFLLYVAMYVWLMMTAVLWESWENSLFILHFLHSQPRSAGSLIYTGIQDALHQCAPTGSVLVSRTQQASFYT